MIQIDIQDNRLSDAQIIDVVTTHNTKQYIDNLQYYKGENPAIKARLKRVIDAPHYKIPVSYARKIIKTVVGYMFKPGLIEYVIEDERYKEEIGEIFRENNEDTKTSALGRQMSIQGIGYELHYVLDQKPRFAKMPAENMIAVHDYSIEPQLVACLWIRRLREDGRNINVFYSDRIDEYFLRDPQGTDRKIYAQSAKPILAFVGSEPHEYEQVPVNIYENNEEQVGDFEPVIELINAYDVLMSDSMNEFDRFAFAYLVLKNLNMDKDEVDNLKLRRVIELFDNGEAAFLQKDIPTQYIQFMSEWIRKEIHKQTHVPDFTDTTLGTEMTGAAIDRLFYDFEFVAADKEDRFRDALKKRFDLINTIMRKTSGMGSSVVEAHDIDIVMNRNKPRMLKELAETANLYTGLVSDKTLLEQFAPFVPDAEAELEQMASGRDPYREGDDSGDIDGDTGPEKEQPED